MAHPETQYAQSDDLSIAFQVWGREGRNLVLVPGIVSHLEYGLENPKYVHWLSSLSELGRLVVFDKRGNGMSDRIQGAPTIDEPIRDIEAVMDAAQMESATLIGMSEGGAMAVACASLRPHRVERLIICGGYAAGRRARGDIDDDTLNRVVKELKDHWGKPDGIHVYSSYGPKHSDKAAYAQYVKEQRMSATPNTIAALFRMAADIDVRPLLSSVTVPTLIIHRRDETSNLRVAQPLVHAIANAEHRILDGNHHVPYEGDVDAYLSAVIEFITGSEPSRVSAHRSLASVLFVDLVESTRQQAQMGDQVWSRLMNQHDKMAERQVDRFRGKLVKFTGDGLLATFDAPSNAVSCAQALAGALSGLGLSCRCGIHTGEIEYRGDDVSGLGVVLAARIMDCADAGQIYVSELTRQLMLGSGLEFTSRGNFRLKGVPEEWALYAVPTA